MPFIPYGRQDVSQEDIDAVARVLESNFITQGPVAEHFEQAVASYCGVAHATVANSATSALHLACVALGVGPGDVVWTSPNSFVASANCARYCGADVDFVDIDLQTLNMSIPALERKLLDARAANRLPKVVIPVHFSGRSCDMIAISRLADEYGFRVLEDATHAIGARYRGRPIGCCAWSDLTVFSFHPVKIITTGEGGMVVGNDSGLMARIARLRVHGVTRDPATMESENEGGWYYQQIELGWNYKMTDIQAALGLSQMDRLDEFVARRRHLANRYRQLLGDLPLTCPDPDDDSAWHLYVVRLDEPSRRRAVYDALCQAGVGANVHYIPIHLQPDYQRLGFRSGDFPHAESYYAGALTLPLFPGLQENDQDAVVAALRQALA